MRQFHFVTRGLLALLMIVFSALVFLQVLVRYVVDLGLFGLNDVTALMAVWMYFLGAGYAAYSGEHIVASLVDTVLREDGRAHRAIGALASLLSAATMLVFAYWAAEYALWAYERGAVSDELKLPRVHFAVPIVAGCLLMAVFFARAAKRSALGAGSEGGGDA